MFDWVHERLPEHVVPAELRRRYLATGLTRRRLARQILSLSTAALVAYGVFTAVDGANDVRRAWGTTRSVVVTTSAISPGDEITRSDIRVAQIPVAMVPADAIPGTAEDDATGPLPDGLVGSRATAPLGVGEILTNTDVTGTANSRFAGMLASGESAVTIATVPGSHGLEAGDLIDIYGPTMAGESESLASAASGLSMSLLCRGARVLGVDDSTVTLIVRDPEVTNVLTAADSGRVSLVLTG